MTIDFAMNPWELGGAGRAIADLAGDSSEAATTLTYAAEDADVAAAQHELSEAFNQFKSRWSGEA